MTRHYSAEDTEHDEAHAMHHTPEPWIVGRASENLYPADVWIQARGKDIAEMSANYDCGADADRIVLCVNALAGMTAAKIDTMVQRWKERDR